MDVEAAYFTVRTPCSHGPRCQVERTVEVRGDLFADLDAAGRVLGIERVGGEIGIDELGAVLRAVPFNSPAAGSGDARGSDRLFSSVGAQRNRVQRPGHRVALPWLRCIVDGRS